MSVYHFWEKMSDDTSNPNTYEEPSPDLEQTPSTPAASDAAPPDPHAEEKHKLDLESQEMALQHKQELHEQRMRHTEELHSAKMQSSGAPGGTGGAPASQQQAAPPLDPQQAQMASQSNLLANYIQAKMGEAMCETPGKKIRSKGKGRGKAVGEGKGPIGRMAEELIPGGEAEGKPASAYPVDQLRVGTKVEKEHTPDPAIAKEIAKDHLEESPAYYIELDKMEKKLEANKADAGSNKKAEWHELKKEIFEHIKAYS